MANTEKSVMANAQKSGKWFKIPDTYALIFFFIVFASILTYIVPAGVYDKVKGSNVIDPNSFHFIKRTSVNLFDAIMSVSTGMIKGASIIFCIFIVSGAFNVINSTGAIDAGIDSIAKMLKGKTILIIPIVMTIMSVLGYLEIIVNQVIVFIPIGLLIARKLKMDPIVGLSMMYVGCYAGFIFGGSGPLTVQVAQSIAGLPLLSGIGLRTIIYVIALIASIIFVMRYAQKVVQDPSNSALKTTEFDWAISEVNISAFDTKRKLIVLLVFVTFGIYIYGAINLKWQLDQLNTLMLILAIVCGALTNMGPTKISKAFVDGCKMAAYSAILIGFATGISIVLTQGNIISTLIYYCAIPLAKTSTIVSAELMFLFNWVFNFFVPSGSGQAAVVMPILAPMGDVIGLSKQVIVSGYKYGDGITNLIIPTSATLMGFIGLARISFDKWFKFIMPLVGIWTLIAAFGVLIGIFVW